MSNKKSNETRKCFLFRFFSSNCTEDIAKHVINTLALQARHDMQNSNPYFNQKLQQFFPPPIWPNQMQPCFNFNKVQCQNRFVHSSFGTNQYKEKLVMHICYFCFAFGGHARPHTVLYCPFIDELDVINPPNFSLSDPTLSWAQGYPRSSTSKAWTGTTNDQLRALQTKRRPNQIIDNALINEVDVRHPPNFDIGCVNNIFRNPVAILPLAHESMVQSVPDLPQLQIRSLPTIVSHQSAQIQQSHVEHFSMQQPPIKQLQLSLTEEQQVPIEPLKMIHFKEHESQQQTITATTTISNTTNLTGAKNTIQPDLRKKSTRKPKKEFIIHYQHQKIQEHQTELQSLTMKSIQKDEKQQEKMTTTTTSTISNTNIKATTATINLDLKHKSTRHPKKECMIKYQHQQNLQHQRQTVFATTTAMSQWF